MTFKSLRGKNSILLATLVVVFGGEIGAAAKAPAAPAAAGKSATGAPAAGQAKPAAGDKAAPGKSGAAAPAASGNAEAKPTPKPGENGLIISSGKTKESTARAENFQDGKADEVLQKIVQLIDETIKDLNDATNNRNRLSSAFAKNLGAVVGKIYNLLITGLEKGGYQENDLKKTKSILKENQDYFDMIIPVITQENEALKKEAAEKLKKLTDKIADLETQLSQAKTELAELQGNQ